LPVRAVWIVAPLLSGALLAQYAEVGRVSVGEVASVTALVIMLLASPSR